MKPSDGVRDALLRFYEAFSSGDPAALADVIATGEGVSVFATDTPALGATSRESWIDAYTTKISPSGWMLRPGDDPKGYEEGATGFGTDTPTAVGPDGSWVPTRITAVVHQEAGEWKVVHIHLSVAVPDEDVIQPPPE